MNESLWRVLGAEPAPHRFVRYSPSTMSWLGRSGRIAVGLLCLALGSIAEAAPDVAERARASQAAPGWLGVALDKVLDGSGGVRIAHVMRGSPADEGGLREGDRIVDVSGITCVEPSCVTRVVSSNPPGSTVVLRVRRGSDVVSVSVKLQARPSESELLRREHQGRFAPELASPLAAPASPSASAAAGDAGPLRLGSAPASLKALRGSVVLVDFWATWCGPCRITIPMLNSLGARYLATGFRVLGVSTESAERVATFAAMERIGYGLYLDRSGDITGRYHVSSFPSMFLIDRRGVVRNIWVGVPDSADLESRIKALLAERADDKPEGP